MRFRRVHSHNGVRYLAGDAFTGSIDTGRFLYHRGVLEADGGADDPLITRNPGKRTAWGLPDAFVEPIESSTAWNSGETQE